MAVNPSDYSVGSKVYNGTRYAPNLGPGDQQGYAERDRKYQTAKRNNALLRRLQARKKKRYISADNLSAPVGRTV